MKHISSLDGFRGIAAICVAVFHMGILMALSETEFFRNSSLFVPFFFVLSGFVIAYVYEKSNFNLKNFLIARSFRILPLYYTMLAIFIIMEVAKFIVYQKTGINFNQNPPLTGTNGVENIIPNILLLQSWLPWADHFSFNYVAWSLSVEWYLYLMFAVLMFLPLFFRRFAIIALVVLAFVGVLSFIGSDGVVGILHFFAGYLMFWIFKNLKDKIANFQNLKLKFWVFNIFEVITLIFGALAVYLANRDLALFAFCAVILVFALSSVAFKQMGGGGKAI